MSRKKRLQTTTVMVADAVDVPFDPTQIDDVVVVRESDASDKLLFIEMIIKTIFAHEGFLPHLKVLIDAQLGPFDHPDLWQAVVTKHPNGRTATFLVGRTLVIYHMGSAKTVDGDEECNTFTQVLIDVIKRHRPVRLWVYNINRLVRDRTNAMLLEQVLVKHRVTIHAAGQQFDMTNPTDQMLWSICANFAAAERDSIHERNLLGKVAGARRNQWPYDRNFTPLGYLWRDRTITPDPTQREIVTAVLTAMADPGLSNAEFTARIGALGVTRPRVTAIHGDDSTVADVLHPKDIRKSFERWLELYEYGIVTERRRTPQPGLKQFGQLPVYLEDPNDPMGPGYIEIIYTFGVVEGGWAPPAVFEAIRQRIEADQLFQTKRWNHRSRRPFGARESYQSGGRTLRIDTNTGHGYRLQEVTFREEPAGSRKKKRPVASMTTLATVRASVLHDTVARGIVAVLSGCGAPGQTLSSGYLPALSDQDYERRLLESRLERLDQEIDRAQQLAVSTRIQEMSERLLTNAERLQEQRTATEADLVRLETSGPSEPTDITISAAEVIESLVVLARAQGTVSHEVAAALERLIPDFQLHLTDNVRELAWTAKVRLPTSDGLVLELGPIHGVVPVRSHHRHQGQQRTLEVSEAIIGLFANGATLQEIIDETGADSNRLRKDISGFLDAGGFPRESSLLLRQALVPELRVLAAAAARARVPVDLLNGTVTVDDLPDTLDRSGIVPPACDPRWAAAVIDQLVFYPSAKSRKTWLGNCRNQAAIDAVAAGQDTVTEVCAALGYHYIDSEAVHRLLGSSRKPGVLLRSGYWDPHRRRGLAGTNRLELIPCPHCDGSATVHLVVPEISTRLLCPDCRRMPEDNSPIFPIGYLNVPRGLAEQPPLPEKEITTRAKSSERDKALIAAYQDPNRQVLDICRQFNTHTTELYAVLERHGIKQRRPYRPRKVRGTHALVEATTSTDQEADE